MFATLGREHRSSYVCCVNAHMAVEAWKDKDFAAVVNDADVSTADGMPILRSWPDARSHPVQPLSANPPWPSLARDAKTPRNFASRADEGPEKSPIV